MERWLVQKMIRFCIQTYKNEITNFSWVFASFSYTDDQHQQTILKLRAFCCRNLNVSQFWDFIWRSLYRWGLLSSFSYLYTMRRVYFVRWTKKICVNPSHDCVSSPLLQSSLVLSLFNVSVEIHSYTQLRSKLGINVYKPHHSQEWSVQ